MATNEKVAYATGYVSHGKKIFRPGEQMTGKVAPEVIRHAQEGGLVTQSHAEAERAKGAEQARQERVKQEIETRSEQRGD